MKAAATTAAAAAAVPSPNVPRVVNQRLACKGQKRKEIIVTPARGGTPIVNKVLQAARIDQHAGAAIDKKHEDLDEASEAAG